MLASLAPLHSMLEFNTTLVRRFLKKFDDKQALFAPSTTVNPAIWQATHLLESRIYFGKAIWGSFDRAGSDATFSGSLLEDARAFPDLAELREAWEAVWEEMSRRMDATAAEEAAREIESYFPLTEYTTQGLIIFAVHHDTYHVGQLCSWWKALADGSVIDALFLAK